MFSCKRCEANFNRKDNLITHLKRITPCEGTLDRLILIDDLKNPLKEGFKCDFCNKFFKSRQSKYQHKRNCKSKVKSSEDKIEELAKTVEELKNELTAIKEDKHKIMTTNNNTTNNINNTQNIINIPSNIKLRDFGKENMEALPESLVSSLFMDLRFRELLANLHCDPNYPENQNIRIKSTKRNTMEIFRNNKWDIMTFSKGLTELLLQGHKIFKEYYNKDKDRILEEDMSEDEIKEILGQLDQIEKLNKEELRPLLVDLQMMLEEYRENGHAIILT